MGRRAGLPSVFLSEHSEVYHYRFTVNGKRYRGSTGARSVGAAQETVQRLYAEASLGRGPAPRRRLGHAAATSLEQLFARFTVWARATGRAASYVTKFESHYRAHFAPRWQRLVDITGPAIERYKVERAAEKASTRTVYKELVTLSRFLRWAYREGHIAELPQFDRIKPVSDYQPPDLLPEQVHELLAALPDRQIHPKRCPVREFFTVTWAQGFRPGETGSLRWEDVDLKRGRVSVRQSRDKARVGRVIALADEARKVLEGMAKEPHLPTALIFGRRDFRVQLDEATARLKLPHVTPHHLRHARLSQLASSTRDVAAVQYLAGHRSLVTTDKYVRSRAERTEKMLRELDSDSGRAVSESKRRKRKGGAR